MAENRIEVVVTGEFSIPREILKENMKAAGVLLSPMIKRKTTALCVGKDAKRAKQEEAALLGIPIVDERYIHAVMAGKQAKLEEYLAVPNYKNVPAEEKQQHASRSTKRVLRPTISAPTLGLVRSPTKRISSPLKENHLIGATSTWNSRGSGSLLPSKCSESSSSSQQPERSSRIVIALEGEIGVGKSTLSKKIAQSFPTSTHVFQEPINEEFLKLFYSDPKKYGFAFQWGMLKSRIFQLQLAKHTQECASPSAHLPKENAAAWSVDQQREKMLPTFYFWDRSMIGDYIFALMNHLQGGISEREFMVYESEFGGSIRQIEKLPFLKDISFFVFLNDEPERCKYRVEHQRGNQSEQGIPLSYYEGLDDIHFDLFLRVMSTDARPVLVLSFGDYDDPVYCRELFADVFNGKVTTPRAQFVEPYVVQSTPDNKILKHYSKFTEVAKTYKDEVVAGYPPHPSQLLNNPAAKQPHRKPCFSPSYRPNVVVFSYECWSASLISPADKNVVVDPCPIDFYKNEFKRVVLWHLAHGHEVLFVNPEKNEESGVDDEEGAEDTDTTDTD